MTVPHGIGREIGVVHGVEQTVYEVDEELTGLFTQEVSWEKGNPWAAPQGLEETERVKHAKLVPPR
jgi:hypothetical protein